MIFHRNHFMAPFPSGGPLQGAPLGAPLGPPGRVGVDSPVLLAPPTWPRKGGVLAFQGFRISLGFLISYDFELILAGFRLDFDLILGGC